MSALHQLRLRMAEEGITYYYIPTADFHESEYVHEYFKVRQYISGFTGSAGVMVVSQQEACLWTDGRYFVQAEQQLRGSEIKLMKQGTEFIPTVEEYLQANLTSEDVLGFDGRVINYAMGEQFASLGLEMKQCDLASQIWTSRPALPAGAIFQLDVQHAGVARMEKLQMIRKEMAQSKADHHLLTSLDDIAWLLNLRGSDIQYTPVFLSYLWIGREQAVLYVDLGKINNSLKQQLAADGVELRDYFAIYDDLKQLCESDVMLFDPARVNYALGILIKQHAKTCLKENPSTMMKAIKNSVELKQQRQAYLKDGIALTKFMHWVKTNAGKITITELSAAQKLLEFREEQSDFLSPSFTTIAAYQEHAAMMHYSATAESDAEIKPEGLFLVDSGGQYLQGTTDVTRTLVLRPLSDALKLQYTTVLKGMIQLSNAKFLYGCKGVNLDILARGPLWQLAIDYQCGTGHGIGFVLGVHEGPQSIRWKPAAGKPEGSILEPGMIVSNEPGVYVANSHGIRIENVLVIQHDVKNEYGQFLSMETLTLAPIDLDGIDPTYLDQHEIAWLNRYHEAVYRSLSPFLEPEEVLWLKQQTRALSEKR